MYVKGVGPARAKVLEAKGLSTVEDLLAYTPFRYEDRSNVKTIAQLAPGEMATVLYEFQNVQDRRMAAQAIPSYAPRQAAPHFNKLECFCFNQYTLEPGEKREWPVVFVIDSRLPKDVATITLSYTFFEVGGKTPAAPDTRSAAVARTDGKGA